MFTIYCDAVYDLCYGVNYDDNLVGGGVTVDDDDALLLVVEKQNAYD